MNHDYNQTDTLTGICNSALAMVGHTDLVQDIDEDTPLAAALRLVLERVVREVQAHEYGVWDELASSATLVAKDKADVRRGRQYYRYNLPLRMMTPLRFFDADTGEDVPHEIVDGYLECPHEGPVRLRYIRYSFNPSEWSVELKQCIIKLLSARMIAVLVKDYASAQRAEQQFWAGDYPFFAGGKKNKSARDDYRGNDKLLSAHYPSAADPLLRDSY